MNTPRLALAPLLLVSTLAAAEVRVQIVETDPVSPATLGHWERCSLRIAYTTDQPIRIRADAYAGGKEVPMMTGGSPRYGPGTGEALFWFADTSASRVDRIVVWAEDEKARKSVARAELPVNLWWTGHKSATPRAEAEWATRMRADEERSYREAIREQMSRPTPWWEATLFLAAGWSIPLYFIVQGVLLWRWRGGWRKAALVPAVPMALVLVHALVAGFSGSNLAPLLLFLTCLPALLYLLILIAIRRLRQPREAA